MNFLPDQLNRLQWEDLERRAFHSQNERFLHVLRRAPVPGGWLLHSYRELSFHTKKGPLKPENRPVAVGVGEGSGLTFLPDPKHQWMLSVIAQDASERPAATNEIAEKITVKAKPELSKMSA
ncbi:MAG: hypothetical protein P1V97_35520 [Planctomycetota bacterium]|nr:hypothetical protein [Planctomycetota bacterium]